MFRVHGSANRAAANYEVLTTMLGDPESRGSRLRRAAEKEIRSSETFERGAQRPIHGLSLTFPSPGLYADRTCAHPLGKTDFEAGIVAESCAELWITIDSTESSTAPAWSDSLLIRGGIRRAAEFGSYGAFLSTKADGALAQVMSAGQPQLSVVPSANTYTGVFTYNRLAFSGDTVRLPIGANLPITAKCVYPSFSMTGGYTDADGAFSIAAGSCAYGIYVTIALSDQYSNVTGPNNAMVGGCSFSKGYLADCRFGNDYAAAAYMRLRRTAPLAVQRFGRTRSVITVWANNNPADQDPGPNPYPTYFQPSNNLIKVQGSRSLGDDGIFVISHEYGHAYHYAAIEAWASNSCSNSVHSVETAYSVSCAFVEGFADFFSAWLTEGVYVNPFFGYSALYFETNPQRGLYAAESSEGNIAAFLLDLVDSPTDPDGVAGDDDSISYPASWIEQTIRLCNGQYFVNLDGSDQLVYCLENALNSARAFAPANVQNNWRTWPGSYLTGPTAPANYSQSSVRSTWL